MAEDLGLLDIGAGMPDDGNMLLCGGKPLCERDNVWDYLRGILLKIQGESRGDVLCDSSECDSVFTDYYKLVKKPEMGKLYKELYIISNYLLTLSRSHVPVHDQGEEKTKNQTREETRQIAEEAAKTVMTHAIADLKETLTKQIEELAATVAPSTKTSCEAVMEPEPSGAVPKTKKKLLIQKIDETGNQKKITDDEYSGTICSQLQAKLVNVQVDNTSHTNNGAATIAFPDELSAKMGKEALEEDPSLKVLVIPNNHEAVLPKIRIEDVDDSFFKDTLREKNRRSFTDAVKSKNPFLEDLFLQAGAGESFKVVYMNENDRSVVVKLSLAFRECIKANGDKLFIGLRSVHVKDHFHIAQCYHCQGFGHKVNSPKCPFKGKDPTCMYCAKTGHRSKFCKDKKTTAHHCCVNCLNSTDVYLNRRARYHTSSSETCPLIIQETKKLMNKTIGAEESKNEYLRQLRMIQEQQRCHKRF